MYSGVCLNVWNIHAPVHVQANKGLLRTRVETERFHVQVRTIRVSYLVVNAKVRVVPNRFSRAPN